MNWGVEMDFFSLISFFKDGKAWVAEENLLGELTKRREYEEVERLASNIAPYRKLTAQEGNELARLAFAFLDAGRLKNTNLVRTVLTRLATIVPGSLKGLHSQLLEKKIFWGEGVLYREADLATRDQLFTLLYEQPSDIHAIAGYVCALSWIGDEEVRDQFSRWQYKSPPWLLDLAQPLTTCMHIAGWELTESRKRRDLFYQECYELISDFDEEKSRNLETIKAVLPREDRCGSCGRHLFNLFEIDLSDPRLQFLGIKGKKLDIAMCPTDTVLGEPLFTDVDVSGRSEWSDVNGDRVEPLEDLNDWEDLPRLPYDQLRLGPARRTPYETHAAYQQKGLSQIGGHPEWAQNPGYPQCPDCGRTMKFVGQLELVDILENTEGMLYAFHCRECGKAATTYQQT